MFLMASVSIKDIVQNQLIVTAFKEGVKEGVPEENKKEVDEIVDKITSYPETNEIIESVINDYANYNTNKTVSDKTIDLIIKFCKDHKDEYEKLTGEKIDISEIDTPENRKAIKDGFNEAMETNKIDGEDAEAVTEVIKVYSSFTSNTYWKSLIVFNIVVIALIGLLSWSYYKWLQPVGIVSIIASVFTFIFYGGLSFLTMAIKESTDFKLSIASNTVLYFAIFEIVIGISFVVLCSVLANRERQALQNTQVTTV
jgi:hypothetical protein